MDIACLFIPHFVVRAEQQREPRLERRPVIVVRSGSQGRTVTDASEDANGIIPGMSLSQAISRCPDATTIPSDPPRYQEAWNHILDGLESSSPLVEDGGLGCVYVDIEGMAHLHGGEENMARALLAAVAPHWGARIGMAPSKFPAYIAATTSAPGKWSRVPEDVPGYLAPFPVDVLPVPGKVIERLHSFGLHALRDVAGLPLSALQAQFGWQGKLAGELANGIDRRPLMPRQPQIVVRESMNFSAPVITTEALLMALENLLGRAFGRAELRGRCARMALLEVEIYQASSFTKRVTFKEPVAGKERAYFVFKNLLADLRLPGPVEAISLILLGIGGEAGRQISLFSDVRQRDDLNEAMRELQARFSSRMPVYKVREVEPWSRITERRRVLVPYCP